MPIKSKAQQRLMYATMRGADTGVPKSTAKKYIEETPKSSYKKMPEKQKRTLVLKKK